MKRQIIGLFAVFVFLAILISPKGILAAPYYEGKRITIIVGVGPGGGIDRIARLLAERLPKHIPGKPTIIVQNMPGATGIIACNYLYNIAKPDGLTFGTFMKGLPFAQLLKAKGVRFDQTKFSWIGSAAVEATVLTLRTDLPYKTVEDLRNAKSPVILGGTGPAESTWQFCVLLKESLGLNLKMVAYPSSADCLLAVERKEVDGRAGA